MNQRLVACKYETQQKRSRLVNATLSVYINGTYINNVDNQHVLGITIDNSLKFDIHIRNICTKLSRLLYLFCSIRNYLSMDGKITFYNSYILPCLDYCITTWGYTNKTNLEKLFRFQKRMGRLVLNDFESSTSTIFQQLGWFSIYERVEMKTAQLVYKCLIANAPESLSRLFTFRNTTRSAPGIDITLPTVNSEFGKKCSNFAGAALWNKLSHDVRFSTNLDQFKLKMKQFILTQRNQV